MRSISREERHSNRGFSSVKARKIREENTIQLRKNLKGDQLFKKRQIRQLDGNDVVIDLEIIEQPEGKEEKCDDELKMLEKSIKIIFIDTGKLDARVLEPLETIQRLLSTDKFEYFIEQIISSGIITRLLYLMENIDQTKKVRLSAAWIITSISSSSKKENLDILVRNNVVQICSQLVLGDNFEEEICSQVLFTLQNLALTNSFRIQIVEQINLDQFVNVMKNLKNISTLEKMIDLTRNLFNNKNIRLDKKYSSQVVPFLSACFQQLYSNNEILIKVIDVLRMIASKNENIEILMSTKLGKKFIETCLHQDVQVKIAAIKLVSNIIAGPDDNINHILSLGFIPVWKTLLFDKDATVRSTALYSFSNICSSRSIEHIDLLMAKGVDIFPKLIDILYNDSIECRGEVVWCLNNICIESGRDDTHLIYLIQNHTLAALAQFLNSIKNAHGRSDHIERCLSTLDVLISTVLKFTILEFGKNESKEEKKYNFDKSSLLEMLTSRIESFEEDEGWNSIDYLLDHDNPTISDLANSLNALQEKFEEITF
jgi:hypothetical protein